MLNVKKKQHFLRLSFIETYVYGKWCEKEKNDWTIEKLILLLNLFLISICNEECLLGLHI